MHRLSNQGNIPASFSFQPDPAGVFDIKPAVGLVPAGDFQVRKQMPSILPILAFLFHRGCSDESSPFSPSWPYDSSLRRQQSITGINKGSDKTSVVIPPTLISRLRNRYDQRSKRHERVGHVYPRARRTPNMTHSCAWCDSRPPDRGGVATV